LDDVLGGGPAVRLALQAAPTGEDGLDGADLPLLAVTPLDEVGAEVLAPLVVLADLAP
jgi:hypothetical protein